MRKHLHPVVNEVKLLMKYDGSHSKSDQTHFNDVPLIELFKTNNLHYNFIMLRAIST